MKMMTVKVEKMMKKAKMNLKRRKNLSPRKNCLAERIEARE